jgi:hypothetical protein
MTAAPIRDAIVPRTLRLPAELQSTSLLTWDGIAEATDQLRLRPRRAARRRRLRARRHPGTVGNAVQLDGGLRTGVRCPIAQRLAQQRALEGVVAETGFVLLPCPAANLQQHVMHLRAGQRPHDVGRRGDIQLLLHRLDAVGQSAGRATPNKVTGERCGRWLRWDPA